MKKLEKIKCELIKNKEMLGITGGETTSITSTRTAPFTWGDGYTCNDYQDTTTWDNADGSTTTETCTYYDCVQ